MSSNATLTNLRESLDTLEPTARTRGLLQSFQLAATNRSLQRLKTTSSILTAQKSHTLHHRPANAKFMSSRTLLDALPACLTLSKTLHKKFLSETSLSLFNKRLTSFNSFTFTNRLALRLTLCVLIFKQLTTHFRSNNTHGFLQSDVLAETLP